MEPNELNNRCIVKTTFFPINEDGFQSLMPHFEMMDGSIKKPHSNMKTAWYSDEEKNIAVNNHGHIFHMDKS